MKTHWLEWSFSIAEFVRESNLIEGIDCPAAEHESIEAWYWLVGQKDLRMKEILKLHKLIIHHIDPRIAGKLRKCNVRVGTYICPDHKDIKHDLEHLIAQPLPKDAVYALAWHRNFENIHPFEDGNGRTGRLIYLWHCKRAGVHPLIFRSRDKRGYYGLFK
jgi:fido (protein-threonine AMPylation protein)